MWGSTVHLTQREATIIAVIGAVAGIAAIIALVYQLRSYYEQRAARHSASGTPPAARGGGVGQPSRQRLNLVIQAALTRSMMHGPYDMLLVMVRNAEHFGIELTSFSGFVSEPKASILMTGRVREGPPLPCRIDGVTHQRWAFDLSRPISEDSQGRDFTVMLGSGERIKCSLETVDYYKAAEFFWRR
jgi:hypothetical protein